MSAPKPYIVIHTTDNFQYRALMSYLEEEKYTWTSGLKLFQGGPPYNFRDGDLYIYVVLSTRMVSWHGKILSAITQVVYEFEHFKEAFTYKSEPLGTKKGFFVEANITSNVIKAIKNVGKNNVSQI